MVNKFKQFRYSLDNFSYLIYDQNRAVAIDAGAVDQILDFLKIHNLELQYVINTHSHADHTSGNQALLKCTKAVYLDYQTLCAQKKIILSGSTCINILQTPGHTMDSLTFHADKLLFSGDTLFNGTVGNCFSGDLKSFFKSIQLLLTFPDDTLIYSGHDYVQDAMSAARIFEPDNPDIDNFLKTYQPEGPVYSSLKMEKRINPFLKLTSYERWEALMKRG